MNLLMKGAALAPPFSCTTKYSSDVYSPRPPDIRVRLLPTKPPVHFTTEQPGRDTQARDRVKERKARTRRLIQEGAVLEKVLPEAQTVGLENLEEYLRQKLAAHD